ncbi:MAG: homoserine dehydrogenase [Synergistaceae bacterium]|nr:homoserine dehydrogenase [Synergistaceae bacterium]
MPNIRKVLLIGFGNVGKNLAVMMNEYSGRLNGMGIEFSVVGVFTRSRGNVADPGGLDTLKLLGDISSHGRFTGPLVSISPLEACRELDYDVMAELSTLAVANKGEPAVSHISAALARGKHAVTANKGPVAFAYPELSRLARENECRFLFESTVMDGAPIFNLVNRCMKGNAITGFSGILNSTTNYVLTRMESGASMDAAIREAIEMGSAEADPSDDIDGWDAAAKVSVLSRVLLGADITPLDVRRSGIRDVTNEMIGDAASRGKRLKLICRGQKLSAGGADASVGIEEIDSGDVFASLSSHDSGIRIESDLMTPNIVIQKNPTPRNTAFGVLEDMISACT